MGFRDLTAVALKVDGRLTPLRVYEADGFLSRARGLIGADRLREGEALWIRPCASVHTIGMRYPIDVVFLDRRQRVLKVALALQPLRFAASAHAHSTLELLAGTAADIAVAAGSVVERVVS